MYYYIFDIKRCKKKSQVESIKNHLTSLGISGEYAYISPTQSATNLTIAGLNKGYGTIVVVGSDDLVNTACDILVGRKEVLGVLPLSASSDLTTLIGSSDWQEAAEALRYRRIREMYVGKLANGQHFVTNIYLDLANPTEITVEFKNFVLSLNAKNFLISNYHAEITKKHDDHLDVIVESLKNDSNSLIARLSRYLLSPAKTDHENNISVIRARSMRLFAKRPVALVAHDKIIAKTPQYVECSDEKLRIIVAKNS